MHPPIYGPRRTIAGLAAVGVLLAAPAARAAFLPLPANGSQVNDDLAKAIDPNLDAGASDIVGGAVTAGKVSVPWATFEGVVKPLRPRAQNGRRATAWTGHPSGCEEESET